MNIPEARHTYALTETRWERLHFRILGHWPKSVVSRRLAAHDLDMADRKGDFAAATIRTYLTDKREVS